MVIPPSLTKKLQQHPVIEAAYRISQETGIAIYLVGGAVRDLLVAILPEKDFDFVIENNLVQVARLFANRVSGSLIKWSSDPLYYRVILYRNQKRIEVDLSEFQGDDLYQDLRNRDFTVNALALAIDALFQGESPQPYDPLEGAKDLRKGILRSASPQSFDHDPLRMLRAVRIAKARDLVIDASTCEEIRNRKERLPAAAAERIRSEFFKTLSFPGAADSLSLLDDLGLLAVLLPEIQGLKDRRDEEPRGTSLWEHALQRVRWCEAIVYNWGTLCPGFEKKLDSHFREEIEAEVNRLSLLKLGGFVLDGERSAPAAKELSVAGALARRFKLGKRATVILKTITGHPRETLHGFRSKKLNLRAYFRFFCDWGSEGLDLLILSWAEGIARESNRCDNPFDAELSDLFESLVAYYFDEYCVASPRPLITGKEIMEQFHLAEGKFIGFLLGKVAEAEAEGLLSCPEEALEYAARLIRTYNKGNDQRKMQNDH